MRQSLRDIALYLEGIKEGRGNLLPLGTSVLGDLWDAIRHIQQIEACEAQSHEHIDDNSLINNQPSGVEKEKMENEICCDAFKSLIPSLTWCKTMKEDDEPIVYVMPCIGEYRVNFCPSCGASVRSTILSEQLFTELYSQTD